MEIRQRSKGRRSLDDVMRRLWNVYGRDFYALPAEQRRGLSETAFADEVREATGLDLSDWLRERTEKPVRLDVESALEVIGLQCQPKSLAGLPSLGARLQRQGDGWLLAQVPPRGAAHLAGLSAGDQVVAIDGLRVGAAGAEALLARYRPGDSVMVHVFRRDELRAFPVSRSSPWTSLAVPVWPNEPAGSGRRNRRPDLGSPANRNLPLRCQPGIHLTEGTAAQKRYGRSTRRQR